MEIALPWRIRRLPEWVPWAAATAFLASALLKLIQPNDLCVEHPWEPANSLMLFLEFPMAFLIASKRRRSFGALLGCGTMIGAAGVLTLGHLRGRDVRTCGCFGLVEMSYPAHLAVIAVLFGLCSAILLGSHEGAPTALPPDAHRAS